MSSQPDNMGQALDDLAGSVALDIHVSLRCKVIKVNKNDTCTVQPLALYKSGEKRGPIQNVPVLKPVTKVTFTDTSGTKQTAKVDLDIKVGDVVQVLFDDRDTTNHKGSKSYTLFSERTHDLNDGTIIGKY